MKELEGHKKEKQDQEQVERTKAEYTHIGSIRKIHGHILWAWHPQTGGLKRVKIVSNVEIIIDKNGKPQKKIHSKVTQEEGWIYFYSLNKKNAIKKVHKMINKLKEGLK